MDNIKKKFLIVLEQSYGIVLTACKSCGIPRSTYYKWLQIDEEFKAHIDDIQEIAIDFVESKLIEKINGITVTGREDTTYDLPPSDTAIIFFLKTRGKKRGYVEKTELDLTGLLSLSNEPITFK